MSNTSIRSADEQVMDQSVSHRPAPRGRFIAFEGIDGSGKSTQISLLKSRLEVSGITTWLTREPTDGQIGQLIRRILSGQYEISEAALTALYAADRLDHVQNSDGILRWLERVDVVLCDRYIMSTYAYHSDQVDFDWIIRINQLASVLCSPGLTIVLRVPPGVALARLRQSRTGAERYETERKLNAVFESYDKLVTDERIEGKIIIIDGTGSPSQVADKVWSTVNEISK